MVKEFDGRWMQRIDEERRDNKGLLPRMNTGGSGSLKDTTMGVPTMMEAGIIISFQFVKPRMR